MIKTLPMINLAPRDHRALSVLAATLIALALYFMLWKPMYDMYENAKARYVSYQENYALLANGRQTNLTTPSDESLLAAANRYAQELGLSPSDTNAEGAQINIRFEKASFTQLMLWLDQLKSSHNVTFVHLEFRRTDANGMVTADIVLQGTD